MISGKHIILGGGMVAGYAAKELVTRGLGSGELLILTSDDALPYERPPLSKGFLLGKESEASILINNPEWYREHGIDVRLQIIVDDLDLKNKQLHTRGGDVFHFDELLIATGARARKLDVPGNDLPNVFYLRSLDDSRKIRAGAANAKRGAVVGGGFIGMEVASALAQQNVETTMIIREDRVWGRVFTREMSEFFERYYASRGVQLLKQQSVAVLQGRDLVTGIVLSGGGKVSCDMVVAGVGATPVTELAAKSGLAVNDGIVVNEYLETGKERVFAAGDVANYVDKLFGKRRRVEHWDNAVSQGRHWAATVSGDRQPFLHVPYFFSDVFDLSYELWGDSEGATQTIVRGDFNSSSFSVWWLKGDHVVSVFAMNRPDEERETAPEWIRAKQRVSRERLGEQNRSVKDAAIDRRA